jgi:hypothetical protein
LRHVLDVGDAVLLVTEVGMDEVMLISGVESAFGVEDIVFEVVWIVKEGEKEGR